MADQVPVNVNYAWKAIRASAFLAGDTQLAEFAMAVTGTLIVTAPTSDGDAAARASASWSRWRSTGA